MCKYYEENKTCPMGPRCHFAHGQEDMRKPNDALPANTPMMPNSTKNPQNMSAPANPLMVNNYKTVVCKYWEQGKCKYQNGCSFAHGDVEKRAHDQPVMNMNGYDPLKDPNIEMTMKIKQLSMIGEALLDLYPSDQVIKNYVTNAMQMQTSNNITGGAETLQKILYNQNLNEEMKRKHEEIVQNAKIFAEQSYDMLKAGKIPDFMIEMQQQQMQAMQQAQQQQGMMS